MTFPNNPTWEKNKFALTVAGGCNFGYSVVDSRKFMIAPLGGIGFNIITPSLISTASSDKFYKPFLPYYKFGFFMDFKSIPILQQQYGDDSYTCLRLSAGINLPFGKAKYSEYYHGSMVYITIGMGGLSRQ
jgi:hypothetical protein